MNKSLIIRTLFLLSAAHFAVLTFGLESKNEGGFSDVPRTHWAAEAVNNLKTRGVLQGYLDGLFRGDRMITRYEMADIINGAWADFNAFQGRIQSEQQIVAKKLDCVERVAADIQALREQIMAVRKVMEAMKPWRQEIAHIKQKSEQFRDELKGRRKEIEAMREDIASIQRRLYRY